MRGSVFVSVVRIGTEDGAAAKADGMEPRFPLSSAKSRRNSWPRLTNKLHTSWLNCFKTANNTLTKQKYPVVGNWAKVRLI